MTTKLGAGLVAVLLAGAAALIATPAAAENHEIRMLNRAPDGTPMVFDPPYLRIQPGDSVTFLATDPSHNAETIAGMVPEGGEIFRGRINEELTVTFTVEGVYGIKCLPHYAMGMVGLIVVGDPNGNLEAARAPSHPPRARTVFAALFEEAGQ